MRRIMKLFGDILMKKAPVEIPKARALYKLKNSPTLKNIHFYFYNLHQENSSANQINLNFTFRSLHS